MSKEELAKVRPVEELECVPFEVAQLMPSPHGGGIVLLKTKEKTVAISIDAHEAPMLSFASANFASNTHVHTIHQLFLGYLKDQGTLLKQIALESMAGDMLYARLTWQDRKHRKFFNLASVCDALILAKLADAPMVIVRRLLDALDEMEDWNYDDEIDDDE